jgi:hypothetical protein
MLAGFRLVYIRGTPEQALAALQTIRNKVGGRRFEEDDYIKKKTNEEGMQIPIDAFPFVFSEFLATSPDQQHSPSLVAEEFRAFNRDNNLKLPSKENDAYALQAAATSRSTSPLMSTGDILLHKYSGLVINGTLQVSSLLPAVGDMVVRSA